jgi:hypothetical protein
MRKHRVQTERGRAVAQLINTLGEIFFVLGLLLAGALLLAL